MGRYCGKRYKVSGRDVRFSARNPHFSPVLYFASRSIGVWTSFKKMVLEARYSAKTCVETCTLQKYQKAKYALSRVQLYANCTYTSEHNALSSNRFSHYCLLRILLCTVL